MNRRGTPQERFWQSVDRRGGSECWRWTGGLNRDGYGKGIRIDGRQHEAHRASYMLLVGEIPAEMTVDHLCFTPSCVNPSHLRLMTSSENSRNQRNASETHCANGHEYTPENTYIRPASRSFGRRDCRTCIRKRVAEYQKRKRTEDAA